MGSGHPYIQLQIDKQSTIIAGPEAYSLNTFSKDYKYIGRVKILWGGDIETCKNKKEVLQI